MRNDEGRRTKGEGRRRKDNDEGRTPLNRYAPAAAADACPSRPPPRKSVQPERSSSPRKVGTANTRNTPKEWVGEMPGSPIDEHTFLLNSFSFRVFRVFRGLKAVFRFNRNRTQNARQSATLSADICRLWRWRTFGQECRARHARKSRARDSYSSAESRQQRRHPGDHQSPKIPLWTFVFSCGHSFLVGWR